LKELAKVQTPKKQPGDKGYDSNSSFEDCSDSDMSSDAEPMEQADGQVDVDMN